MSSNRAPDVLQISGGPVDRLYADGFRYRAFACEHDFAPVTYANLARLKRSSVLLFDKLRRQKGEEK